MARSLLAYCQAITIDYREGTKGGCGGTSGSGFVITPKQPLTF
ncbi:hypothetical protein [Desulfofustis limnaeus]|uniref:Uncharacterized protein n=1 Tax=Desulfofustis limnaeus TaxID=2740163 RepID=A0ABM7WDK4_9BACT|nr:hypothetical protein [Desulfofustis limnaeus]MDX9896538.1 hypothetical protein [Desulfofustis sp.]BDD89057.1 hypothetical protein DPPLL_34220 [Desulfofustis limnaeus]